MSALVFLDTETTGLGPDDEIWEVAAIRREPDGAQTEHHAFVQHDVGRCAGLPEPFRGDHLSRFPMSSDALWHPLVKRKDEAAELVYRLTADRPHIVGNVPNFDTERLALLLRAYGYQPRWHYHLIDVEAMAYGWLYAQSELPSQATRLPWRSDDLSRACGVEPPGEGERHTAMGDARWAMRWYDALTGGAS